ncbi:DUF930 domain-containing protein [Agrobacterium rhizogenes]|nr:DUF930 domain-containing protein [Rhizobium rhizogenes]NTJ82063.1 DUF930 domain-containing protein [Rhizobium rhizogenes]
MTLSDLHQRWHLGRSFSASAALHVVVVLMILAFTPSREPLEPTEDNLVSVEIIAPQRLEMVRTGETEKQRVLPMAPKESPTANRNSEVEFKPAPADQTIETPKSEMIRATKLYAVTTLAARRATKVRAALRKLGTQEKVLQLCNMEAMEQIARWDPRYRPEYVIAYAMSDPALMADSVDKILVSSRSLTAAGHAVHRVDAQHQGRHRVVAIPSKTVRASLCVTSSSATLRQRRQRRLASRFA